MLCDIKSRTREELETQFQEWDEPAYRVDQLLHWLYARRVTNWDAMENLPKALRERLGGHYTLRSLELVGKRGAQDATQKFLWRLDDHSLIESVLIPASRALYGEASDRQTLCVSTQVGCAYGCKFCASGLDGWKRNLRVEEIVDQVLAVERWNAKQRQNPKPATRTQPDAACGPIHPARTTPPAARFIDNLVIMGMGPHAASG